MEIDLNRLTAVDLPVVGSVRLPDEGGPASHALPIVRFPEPLRIEAAARRQGDVVRVAGRLEGRVEVQCDRCLVPVGRDVAVDFEARFAESLAPQAPRGGGSGGDEDDGVQLAREDLDVSFLAPGAHAISVADIVREQVLLDVPLRTLCRDECRGLCARCGADLNAGACGCPPEAAPKDLRLAALAEIRKKLESDN